MRKFERALFLFFVFCIPFQSRLILHKWTQPFNQWTSLYFYGVDLLLIVIFLSWFLRSLKNHELVIKKCDFNLGLFLNPTVWLQGFFIISAISVLNAGIVSLALYQLLRLAEFIAVYFYFKSNLGVFIKIKDFLLVIICSAFFQALIAIFQYLRQSSLGFRILGESPISVNVTGVAVFIANGQKYLRSYGTTPHPNILAAWLMVGIFSFCAFYLFYFKKESGRNDMGILSVLPFLLFGFLYTYSRVIIGLCVLGLLVYFFIFYIRQEHKTYLNLKKRFLFLILTFIITFSAFAGAYWPQILSRIHISSQEEAVTQRAFFNRVAESVATSHPFFGIGIGQFVANFIFKLKHLPAITYQPVHNIYLLIASETGFIGLFLFVLFLFFSFLGFIRRTQLAHPADLLILIISLAFLITGFFDHFLWTSQQGSLVLWITMAFLNFKSIPGFD